MNASEFWSRVHRVQTANPTWRWGQTCFNVLHSVDSEAADIIRGTRIDPFNDREAGKHDNSNYLLFVRYVEEVFRADN